jgi:hypothetical protein
MRTAGLTIALALGLGVPAFAQTQLLVGSQLVVKNPRQGVAANKLLFVSKDAAMATPASSLENPRCMPFGTGAARLTVSSTSGQSFTIDLGGARCVHWLGAGSRWKYKDPTGLSCRTVLITGGTLQKAVCRGPQVAFQLGEAQGSVDVVLSTGTTPRRWCTTFNDGPQGCIVKKDGSDGRRFVAIDCTSAAASCGASPSGGSVDQPAESGSDARDPS